MSLRRRKAKKTDELPNKVFANELTVLEIKDSPWIFSDEAFEIYGQCLYQPTKEKYGLKLKRYQEDADIMIFAAEKEGRKVGILVLRKSGKSGEIIGIAVEKSAQRRGIGRRLVNEAMSALGLDEVWAETDDDAVRFYQRIGFCTESHIEHYEDGDVTRYSCRLQK